MRTLGRSICWLFIACAPLSARVTFTAASLRAPSNLLSNPSFEAATEDRPLSYQFPANSPYLRLSSAASLHGRRSFLADVPTSTTTEVAARQELPACQGCTYELSAWVLIAEDRGGEAQLGLQARAADGKVLAQEQAVARGTDRSWRQLQVRLRTPPGTAQVSVSAPLVVGGMMAYYDALRLSVTGGRSATHPPAGGLTAARVEATWLVLRWSGPPGTWEVDYRVRGRGEWTTGEPVRTTVYSLVGLKPDTRYQVRVRLVPPPYYDLDGVLNSSPVQPTATLLLVNTAAWAPRVVGALRLWPPVRVGTFPSGQTTPRLAAWNKMLYLAESYQGALYLSRVQPEGYAVEWTRELIAAPETPAPPQLVDDLCVVHDRLYLLVRRTTGGPPGTTQEWLYAYDLQQERLLGAPLPIGKATGGGGLALNKDQLWVMWSELDTTHQSGEAKVLLAPVNEGGIGETHEWTSAPTRFVRHLTLGALASELLLGFTDAAWSVARPGYEPLSVVRFNGLNARGLRKIADLGRNSAARGAQLGSNYYLFYGTDVPWTTYGSRYSDLRLATLLPEAPVLDTITYLSDMKYNLPGSAAVIDEALYLAHEKLEEAPSNPQAPPYAFGTFLGRIDLGAALPPTR